MSLKVFTAYDQKPLETLQRASAADIEAMLKLADETFKDKSAALSIEARCEALYKIKAQMQENKDFLAMQIAKEGGKPLVDAKVEVARAIDGIQVCIEHVRTRRGQQIPMDLNAASTGKLAVTRFEPRGVVVAISAFNHPLNLIVHQVAPAIAAGCPVIVKPASSTPLSAKSFVEYAHQAMDKKWVQLCLASGSDAEKLATDERVAFLSFIGSSKVGWGLRAKLAPGARCALEHGGIAPVIVDESANINKMLPKLVKGGFYHAGQVCVSVQRVYVPNSQLHNISAQLCDQIKALKVGDPTLEDTDVGPLIAESEVARVDEWIKEAITSGANCPIGGKILSNTTYEPTLLINPGAQSKVLQHELFGPAIVLVGYDDLDTAIELANEVPYAFQAAVFSDNIDRALYVNDRINAATVMINDHTAFRVDWMPFAGLKQSGHGVGGIPYTMDEMSQEKLTVFNYGG